jgi:hypothetical protein
MDLGPTQPPIQWVSGVLSPGVKLGWGHSPLFSAEVRVGAIPPLPPSASMACSEVALLHTGIRSAIGNWTSVIGDYCYSFSYRDQ